MNTMNTVVIDIESKEVLIVDLKTFEMTCYKDGEKYVIQMQKDGATYFYERSNIATGEIIDADIVPIEVLQNGRYPSVVHWMSRGYRGLPAEKITYG